MHNGRTSGTPPAPDGRSRVSPSYIATCASVTVIAGVI